jgi:predicted DNA-binding protein with PD1-like motif
MKYQIGQTGRAVVVRFEDGEDVLKGLADVARSESIKSAVLYLVGGMKRGKFVVGPETEDLPPVPVWRQLGESHEVLAVGTIFWDKEGPKAHIHGAFGKGDGVKVGCLREDSSTFLVLEAVIIELKGIDAVREFDPKIGLTLLKL